MQEIYGPQNIEDVLAYLQDCETERSALISDVIQERCHARNQEAFQDTKIQELYGTGEWTVPVLLGLDNLPWAKLPTEHEIAQIVETEVQEHEYSMIPSRDTPEVDDSSRIDYYVTNLNNPNYWTLGAIQRLSSPKLDTLRIAYLPWECEGMIFHSNFQVTAMSTNCHLDVELNKEFMNSTLITGVKVWMVFAPSSTNLTKLREYFDTLATEYGESDLQQHERLMHQLEGGIAFIQKPGETVFIPPYCPFSVFAAKASTSAEAYLRLANGYTKRLQNIPLAMAVIKLARPSNQQAELSEYADDMFGDLEHILTHNIAEYDPRQEIKKVCEIWDTVKDDFRNLCAAIANGDKKKEEVGKVWIDFLVKHRQKKTECRLCHLRILAQDAINIPNHFWEHHWEAKSPAETSEGATPCPAQKAPKATAAAKKRKAKRRG